MQLEGKLDADQDSGKMLISAALRTTTLTMPVCVDAVNQPFLNRLDVIGIGALSY